MENKKKTPKDNIFPMFHTSKNYCLFNNALNFFYFFFFIVIAKF